MKMLSRIKFWIIGILTIIGIIACVYLLADENRQRAILEKLPSLEMPLFSVPGGFYSQEFYLEMNAPAGCQVYYTTDGSDPDPVAETSGMEPMLYEAPILISAKASLSDAVKTWQYNGERSEAQNATILRAICVKEDGQCSKIATATYFIGEPEYEDHCVVSIVMEPEDLFGEQGIYVNYEGRGKEWEREINLEVFEKGLALNQPAGIRIQGSSARELYAKRFSVFSRKEYSGSKLFMPLQGGGAETGLAPSGGNGASEAASSEGGQDARSLLGDASIHSFVLREGFMNAFIQHMVQDRDVASADAKEAYVFVNGYFWYCTMLQEKYSSTFFEQHYGFKKDNVILIKGDQAETDEPGDMEKFQEIYDYLRTHDMAETEAYEGFGELVDVQSYIDFCCVNLYFGNLDFNEQKNVYYWRSREAGKSPWEDGRWRWGLYDLDLENLDYGYYETDINTFALETHYAGGAFRDREMFVALRRNPQFCKDFVDTFLEMIDTEFTLEHAREVWENWNCTPEIWRRDADWCENYFPVRNQRMKEFLLEEFGLKEE